MFHFFHDAVFPTSNLHTNARAPRKTLPYALLLHGKKGTADFGGLRDRNPILPCSLVA